METVIGLGSAGCHIVDEFAKYDQNEVYKVDTGLDGLMETRYGNFPEKGIYSLAKQPGPEEYEANCPDMSYYFKNIKGEVLFIVGGSGDVSGASLAILEQLRHCEINILYIRPDIELLSPKKKAHERASFNILQEYARSAVFKRIFLIDNSMVEDHLGDVPLVGYYSRLNELIVSTIHMINVYNHLKPLAHTFSEPHETARLSTVGLADLKTGESKLFFPLDNLREMRYYYAINKEKLKSDGSLSKKIKTQVKESSSENTAVSYGIYSTQYKEDYVYTMGHSSIIQTGENDD